MSDRSSLERTVHFKDLAKWALSNLALLRYFPTELRPPSDTQHDNMVTTPFSVDFIPPDTANKVRVLIDCCRHFLSRCFATPKLYEFVISTRRIHRAARYHRPTFNLTARTRANNRLTQHTCMLSTAIKWVLSLTSSFSC